MRLFLLPISSRRTLLYCERLAEPPGQQTSFVDKATVRAAKLWSEWEQKPVGSWQQRVVASGNTALRRIAFEEWGLKSVPPLSARRRVEAAAAAANEDSKDNTAAQVSEAAAPVEVVYPPSVISAQAVSGVLHRLSTDREALHRKRLIWCFVGMPISAPFGLIPVIPNIPFFYLAYRAWSHWRALSGGKHIQHLLQNNRLVYTSSPVLDAIYTKEKRSLPPASSGATPIAAAEPRAPGQERGPAERQPDEEGEERLLISNPEDSKAIAGAFDAPALELELERAIWQVETALEKESKKKAAEAQQQQLQQPPSQEKKPPSAHPGGPPTQPKDSDKQ